MRQRYDQRAQSADLDSQARPVRIVRTTGTEHARDQGVPADLARPRLGERPHQRKQNGARRQRPPHGTASQTARARVDHQRARVEQRCDLLQAQRLLAAADDAPGCGTIERSPRFRHFARSAGTRARLAALCARASACAHVRMPPAPDQRAASAIQARPRSTRRSPAARAACRPHRGVPARPWPRQSDRAVRVGVPQSAAPAARWRDPRAPPAWAPPAASERVEPPRSRMASATSASATTQRARASCLVGAETSRGAPQQRSGQRMLAELGHGNAAQRQRGRIVAQAPPA